MGGDEASRNVVSNVMDNKESLIEFIKERVKSNNKITRKVISEEAGVSMKTIERTIKEIANLRYVGTGKHGHWELEE